MIVRCCLNQTKSSQQQNQYKTRTVAHIPRGLDVDLFKRPILRFAQWIAKLVVVCTFERVARVNKVRGRTRDGHGHQDVGRRGQAQGFRATPEAAGRRTRQATPKAQRLTRITIKTVGTGLAKRRARVADVIERKEARIVRVIAFVRANGGGGG
jgi:hypothetical protein